MSFSFGLCCDGCEPPCDWDLQEHVYRCPPVYHIPQTEEYTFTYDGPNGEHIVQVDKIDKPGGAKSGVQNPAPGEWTILVSGPDGTYTRTVTVVQCESVLNVAHAMHGVILGCHGNVVPEADWSVSGPGVATPSSGTTTEGDIRTGGGQYSYLIYEDGDYDVRIDGPGGTNLGFIEWTIRKLGLSCPKTVASTPETDWIDYENMTCGCNAECVGPVTKNLVLTTKYGSFAFTLDPGTGSAVLTVVAYDGEARARLECPNGVLWADENGGGANAKVWYTVSCAFVRNRYAVTKSVQIMPTFVESYGNWTHHGWRMCEGGVGAATGMDLQELWPGLLAGQTIGGYGETEPYECHTVSGTAQLDEMNSVQLRLGGPVIPGWPIEHNCLWPYYIPTPPSYGVFTIPGTEETVMIAEAP